MVDDTSSQDITSNEDRDVMHRFLFDDTDLRGEVATLGDSYGQVLVNNPFPESVQTLLGEFLAAASLLSGRLKFDGILTLQARGEGPLPLIMAECSNNKELRAVAQLAEGVDHSEYEGLCLPQLLGKGVLAIIVEPKQGQRYQGIVPLDADTLAGCLEHYFEQSEQLKTRFWLRADVASKAAAGMMLQAMPEQTCDTDKNQEAWETAEALAKTLTAEEQLGLDHQTLLFRLFHELQVRMFEAEPVRFHCRCSREASERALVSLGRQEVESLIAEQEQIIIDCQFCNQQYRFGNDDLDTMFGGSPQQLH